MLKLIVAALLIVSATALLRAEDVLRFDAPRPPPAGSVLVAQGEVSIPSDAQLERLEERAITTNPLDDSRARAIRGGDEAENREMDRRAHQIDEQLMKDGGICAGCK